MKRKTLHRCLVVIGIWTVGNCLAVINLCCDPTQPSTYGKAYLTQKATPPTMDLFPPYGPVLPAQWRETMVAVRWFPGD